MANNDRDAGRRKNVPAQAVRPGDRVEIDGGYPEKVDEVVMRPGSVELSLSGGFAGPRRMRFGKADMVRVAVGGSGSVTKGVRREG